MNQLLTIALLLIGNVLVNADTPANCTYDEIAGQWRFYESEKAGTRSENCTGNGK